MDILVMVGQLILGLSILVGLHELGHLLTAKAFKMRVEQFFIWFPPKIFSIKKGETEYGIGTIPLGGYVKIAGMVDESLDTENLNAPPQPWEFRAKPAWQRLIVMLGGIIVNIITGIVIFIVLAYCYGEAYIPNKEVPGIVAHPLAQEMGLRTGDKIVKINGQAFENFSDVVGSSTLLSNNSYYTIERNGQVMDIKIPNDMLDKLAKNRRKSIKFIDPLIPFEVESVLPDFPAAKSGLKKGDKIVGVNDIPVKYFHELQNALLIYKDKQVELKVERDGKDIVLKSGVDKDGKIGVNHKILLKKATLEYSLGESIAKGTSTAFNVVFDNIKGFGKIFRGEVSASNAVSGPIGIAQIFGNTWDWYNFWRIVGVLSMVLAFMNFLPIPALDGGHVMFITFEMITGRKLPNKFLEVAQKIGMVILLALMAFAIFNDVFKLFF